MHGVPESITQHSQDEAYLQLCEVHSVMHVDEVCNVVTFASNASFFADSSFMAFTIIADNW